MASWPSVFRPQHRTTPLGADTAQKWWLVEPTLSRTTVAATPAPSALLQHPRTASSTTACSHHPTLLRRITRHRRRRRPPAECRRVPWTAETLLPARGARCRPADPAGWFITRPVAGGGSRRGRVAVNGGFGG